MLSRGKNGNRMDATHETPSDEENRRSRIAKRLRKRRAEKLRSGKYRNDEGVPSNLELAEHNAK